MKCPYCKKMIEAATLCYFKCGCGMSGGIDWGLPNSSSGIPMPRTEKFLKENSNHPDSDKDHSKHDGNDSILRDCHQCDIEERQSLLNDLMDASTGEQFAELLTKEIEGISREL